MMRRLHPVSLISPSVFLTTSFKVELFSFLPQVGQPTRTSVSRDRRRHTRASDFNSPIWLKVMVPLNGSGSVAAMKRTALTVTESTGSSDNLHRKRRRTPALPRASASDSLL
jgi:hypothetical protein